MKILIVGDVCGRPGRAAFAKYTPELKKKYAVDVVIVNGENSAGGKGITRKSLEALYLGGADIITTGNHVWDKKEVLDIIDAEPFLIRPANYPPGTPGRGATVIEARNGARVLVVNVMGRLFMDPLDDPFAVAEREIAACPLAEQADAIILDVHAEATSEKQAMAHHFDGRVSLVVGTHTHVPTADYQILPGGTAFQSDAGMCGDYDSVIGMEKDEPINRFTTKIGRARFEPAGGEATICGLFVETDERTGLAKRVEPLRLGGRLSQAMPKA